MLTWLKNRFCPGKEGFISYVPSCLLLAIGYAYSAALLAWPGRGLPRHDHFGHEGMLAAIMAAFCVWHACGYLRIIRSDQSRKRCFLLSGTFLAGFATLLISDGSYLSGGYVALGALIATYSYWRYPRRTEHVAPPQ